MQNSLFLGGQDGCGLLRDFEERRRRRRLSVLRNSNERRLRTLLVLFLPPGLEVRGQSAHAPRGMVRVQVRELRGEDGVLEYGLPEEREVALPRPPEIVMGTPRRIERVDDQIAREAT